MQDRVPAPGKENRVRIRLDDGQSIEGVLEYADEASVQGSVYNKANVLPDDVCTALGISTTAEPKEAFYSLKSLIDTTKNDINGRFVTGTYTGDESSSREINLGFEPLSVMVRGDDFIHWNNVGDGLRPFFEYTFSGANRGELSNLQITSTGFNVRTGSYNNMTRLNASRQTYYYFAIKK